MGMMVAKFKWWRLVTLVSLLATLVLYGCPETPECVDGADCGVHPIGSWPTPELADEPCDGVDNDADGLVDEGCECGEAAPRPCVAVDTAGACRAGSQPCEQGFWRACEELSDTSTQALSAGVAVASSPAGPWRLGVESSWPVVWEVTPRCAGVLPPELAVVLEVGAPWMRVSWVLKDLGEFPDEQAGDGRFALTIVNPFGPGVSPQRATVEASAWINGAEIVRSFEVDLEVAP